MRFDTIARTNIHASPRAMQNPEPLSPLPEERPHRRGDTGLIAGVTLIVLGGLFLLVNLTDFRIGNWPAVLMLVPGGLLLAQVIAVATKEGGLYRSVRPSLIAGLVLLVVGCLSLFHLSLKVYWPVVLIAIGIGMTLARHSRPVQ
jgi:hypothetical protein